MCACACACVRACVLACVRACLRARACARACVRVHACARASVDLCGWEGGRGRHTACAVEGLGYLHRLGLTHGNLRPSNMLVLTAA